MSEHLPECLHSRPCERAVRGTGDRHVVSGSRCDNCDDPCICDRLRACTVRVLGEAREAVDALPADLRASNNDGVGGMVVHADGTASQFSKPETFREYVERERALATIDRLAQEAP